MKVTEMKSALRKSIQARLSSISPNEIQSRSTIIQNRVVGLKDYKEARSIAVYLSMPSGEASTNEIVKDALGQGKVVFVPYLHKNPGISRADPSGSHTPKRIMNMVSLHSLKDFESLERDKWGIPTPDEQTVSQRRHVMGEQTGSPSRRPVNERLDLVIMPGVAFDRSGNRLGHGRGFYDFFLAEYREAQSLKSNLEAGDLTDPLLVAISLPEQLLAAGQVPTEVHDRKVDLIVTDAETVLPSNPTHS